MNKEHSDKIRLDAFNKGRGPISGAGANYEDSEAYNAFGEVLALARFMHAQIREETALSQGRPSWEALEPEERFRYLNLAGNIVTSVRLASTVRWYDK